MYNKSAGDGYGSISKNPPQYPYRNSAATQHRRDSRINNGVLSMTFEELADLSKNIKIKIVIIPEDMILEILN